VKPWHSRTPTGPPEAEYGSAPGITVSIQESSHVRGVRRIP
jgi:hypothetical protein